LNGVAIAGDDAKIARLNAQLDKVTLTATAAMGDLAKVTAVLGAVTAIASIVDGVLGIVAKA
jgi:hypothetical protein